MKTVPIYLILIAFWLENVLGLRLTPWRGLSFFNVALYFSFMACLFSSNKIRAINRRSNPYKYLIILTVVMVCSVVVKWILGQVPIEPLEEIILFKDWLNPFLCLFIVFTLVDDEKSALRVIYALAIVLVATILAELLVTYGLMSIGRIQVTIEGRAAGFAEANQYAAYLVLMLPLLVSFFFLSKHPLHRFLVLGGYFVGLTALVVTGSRGGLVSYAFSVLVLFSLLSRNRIIRMDKGVILLAALLLLVVASAALAPRQVTEGLSRKMDVREARDVSGFTSGRLTILQNGLELFVEHPFIGNGFNAFMPLVTKKYHMKFISHNEYLGYLVNQGILGCIFFIALFVSILKRFLRLTRNRFDPHWQIIYIGYVAGLAGYMVAMLAVNITNPAVLFWMYTGALYGASNLKTAQMAFEAMQRNGR
jgi:O-antigen ligase